MRKIKWSFTDSQAVDIRKELQEILNGGNVELYLPEGRYNLDGGLLLYDNTRIFADPEALIRWQNGFASRWNDFLLSNADMKNGNQNIEIRGGIWDANGAGNPRCAQEDYDGYGGVGIAFKRVKNLTMENLILANADSFFVRLCHIDFFRFVRIKFFNALPKMNQDGIHINGFCRNGVIRELEAISPFTPSDDMVALNADDGDGVAAMHGSELGPIENIEIEGLYAQNAHAFIRMLSQDNPIRNIRISRLRGGARCNFININRWDFAQGKGNISNIRISDIEAHKMPWDLETDKPLNVPLLDINLKVHDFEIRNLRRPKLDDGTIPTMVLSTGIPMDVELELAKAQSVEIDGSSQVITEIQSTMDRLILSDGGIKRLYVC